MTSKRSPYSPRVQPEGADLGRGAGEIAARLAQPARDAARGARAGLAVLGGDGREPLRDVRRAEALEPRAVLAEEPLQRVRDGRAPGEVGERPGGGHGGSLARPVD